jgi:hypothetical protein
MKRRSHGLTLVLLAALVCHAGQRSLSADERDCLGCHGVREAKPAAGKSVTIDAEAFRSSVHGQAGLDCTDCHVDLKAVKDFPHAAKLKPAVCSDCHDDAAAALETSVHAGAASCADCHGGHGILSAAAPPSRVSRKNVVATCGECHGVMEKDYREGVHGRAYAAGNLDVPVCTDCHSGHDIRLSSDRGSRIYATKVAGVCARCHDDERLARQYGFLTSRLKTYSRSFHGTVMKSGEIRVANCASCHGFHNIRPSSDPLSPIHPANLPKTCGKCHAGAGKNFARGRIHTGDGQAENPWARAVRLFYTALMSALVLLFLVYIAADLGHRMKGRWRKT